MKALDAPVNNEAGRDAALTLLKSLAEGDEPLAPAVLDSVPCLLHFLRRLPEIPPALVPPLLGAAFQVTEKISSLHPAVLSRRFPSEAVAALSQLILFLPSGSRWVVCDLLGRMLVAASEESDALLAMLLDANLFGSALECVWPLRPARDAFEAATFCAIALKRALKNNSAKSNQVIDAIMRRGTFGERLAERLLEKKEALPAAARDFAEKLFIFVTAKFPGLTGSKAVQLRVAGVISDDLAEGDEKKQTGKKKTVLLRVLDEWHKGGAVTDMTGVPQLSDLLSFE